MAAISSFALVQPIIFTDPSNVDPPPVTFIVPFPPVMFSVVMVASVNVSAGSSVEVACTFTVVNVPSMSAVPLVDE